MEKIFIFTTDPSVYLSMITHGEVTAVLATAEVLKWKPQNKAFLS